MTKGTRLAGCVYLREEDANIRRMNRDRPSAVRYRASIAAGSLKVSESRTIADLLLRGVNAHDWRAEVTERNVLQIRSPKTAARLAQLLRARLELMQPALWEMVRDGSALLATHACLAAAVLPLLSVGEMTLRLYAALNYSQNSAHDLRRALNGA